MGWSTFEERLMKNQLKYKIRLERMNNKRYAKKVYHEIGKGGKWIQSCGRNVKKCGLKKNCVVNKMGEVNGWIMESVVVVIYRKPNRRVWWGRKLRNMVWKSGKMG